jgi:hypothetical protein
MIPVLIPPAPAPIGSAAGPNADCTAPTVPGDGSEGGAFLDLLSLLIATTAAPAASAPSPLVGAGPDRAEGLMDAAPVPPTEHAENEEAASLPSEDRNTLVALQILMAAMTASPPTPAVPIPPTGPTFGDSVVASSVAGTMTDPMVAAVAAAQQGQSGSPLTPSIRVSGDTPLEAGAAPGAPAPVRELRTTSRDPQAITLTVASSPIPMEALEPTSAVPRAAGSKDPGGAQVTGAAVPSAKTFEPIPGVPVPMPAYTPEAARDAVEVAPSTAPSDGLRPPPDNVTAGGGIPREAAPPDRPAETAPLENLVANRHGELTRTVSVPLYRLDDRGTIARTAPAEREDGSSSAFPAAAPSGISLPAVEQGRAPHDFRRDQEEAHRAPTPAAPEAPRGTERVAGAVATGSTASVRDAAAVASVRDELPQMNLERVASAARASLARGGIEVRLHLHPESLGEVRVQVRWESGTLSARLEAATPAARDALESGAPALRATLQEYGIPVERLSVNVRMDGEARPQHRPHAPENPVRDDPTRDRSNDTEATPILDPVAMGRVDIRI